MLKSKKKPCASELIREKLETGRLIQPFPRVVGQLLTAINDPNASSKSLARIIEADAALSTRLLRMANSPMYGYSNIIKSIKHATIILGTGPLRNLALTFAGSSLFSGSSAENGHREDLWNHSLGCATMARLLAKFVSSVNADEAFLAGIFHDVGKLFFLDVIPKEYGKLVGGSCGQKLVEQEQELFGLTHEEIGARLTTTWQLPEQLMVVVGFHHHPEQAIAHGDLTTLVHVADGLARAAGIGSAIDPSVYVLDKAKEQLFLEESAIDAVQDQAREQFKEAKQVFAD